MIPAEVKRRSANRIVQMPALLISHHVAILVQLCMNMNSAAACCYLGVLLSM
jgi:hypothetical protein